MLPPQVPGGLTATSPDADGNYVVSWDSVSTASSYTLERQPNGGSKTTQSTSTISVPESSMSSGSYSYRVRACNAVGCSSYSSAVIVAVSYSVSFQYDVLGRLIEASVPGKAERYYYDDAGNRVSTERVQGN